MITPWSSVQCHDVDTKGPVGFVLRQQRPQCNGRTPNHQGPKSAERFEGVAVVWEGEYFQNSVIQKWQTTQNAVSADRGSTPKNNARSDRFDKSLGRFAFVVFVVLLPAVNIDVQPQKVQDREKTF